ncbi:hypothetical protein H6F95_20925 [Cyanobacteria bacterium FACHB-471]|nr:hypothetical protein [Cyanobacteria bacterium FACHB-471]
MLFIFLNLGGSTLSTPFSYAGDALYKANEVKTMMDTGWLFHNPSLGAPFSYDRLDFPRFDSLNYLIMKIFLIFTKDYAIVLNSYYLLSFILCALSALFVMKHFKVSNLVAFYGSILFAFLPYPFFRGIPHFSNAAYYMIPLSVMVLLWTALGSFFKDGKISRKHLLVTFLISFLTSLQMPYNGFFMAVLTPAAGLSGFLKTKNFRALLIAVFIWFSIASAFTIEQIPRIQHKSVHGVNVSVAERSVTEVELYSLRLSQLLVPHFKHRIDKVAEVKDRFDDTFLHTNENKTSYLGLWGAIGFLFLLFFVVFSKVDKLESTYFRNIPASSILASLSALNIVAFSYATFAGFSAMFAFFVEPKIRATNRISVYIAFLSIFALCIVLDVVRRSFKPRKRFFINIFLAVIFFISLLDQTSPKLIPKYDAIQENYEHDKQYFSLLEERLPDNAAVYQMPYAFYPERGPINKMTDYEHLKAYFHTSNLRWSYGSARGRQGYYWNMDLAERSPAELVQRLENFGFSAIYINRLGFEDRAETLMQDLSNLLQQEPLISENERYATFFLPDSDVANPPYLAEPYKLGDTISFSANAHPMVFYSLGWAKPEDWGTGTLGKDARLVMQVDGSPASNAVELSAIARAFVNEEHPKLDVEVIVNGEEVGQWEFVYGESADGERKAVIPADLVAKQNPLEIVFKMPNAKSPAELGISSDGRVLGLGIYELRLDNVSNPL